MKITDPRARAVTISLNAMPRRSRGVHPVGGISAACEATKSERMESTKANSLKRRLGVLTLKAALLCAPAWAPFGRAAAQQSGSERQTTKSAYVRVSRVDPRYFELSNGEPYVPVGLNIAWLRFITDEREGLAKYEEDFRLLAANGGNFVRIFLSHPFFNPEQARAGQYDETRARRVDAIVRLARRYGIRIKFCLEHFRSLDDIPPKFPGSISMGNPLYRASPGASPRDITEFFTGDEGRALYARKLGFYAARYRDEPAIFGWELWNEIDAVRGEGWTEWTEAMLDELKKQFPRHLAMQSLGSYDTANKRALYRQFALMSGNEVAQVHRYLDQGASLAECKGPMDALAANAVGDLLSFNPGKPVLLSEVGAVEPNHAAPSKLYEADRDGVLLHDQLFAPFFAGSAGPGQSWHWMEYVERHNLWHHFGRFSRSIAGIDPRREAFRPIELRHPQLRVYALQGEKTFVAWCRDTQSTWESELVERNAPAVLRGLKLDLPGGIANGATIRIYNPWKNQWTTRKATNGSVALPDFNRSLVIRIER